jgi:hypothetical protein
MGINDDFDSSPRIKPAKRELKMPGKNDFDVFVINLRNPLEAFGKTSVWWFLLIPAGMGLLGYVNRDNLASVAGGVVNRVIPQAIQEAKPLANGVCKLQSQRDCETTQPNSFRFPNR